ncbi:MAG: glycosyltransferase family 2 protein [Gemmatimonadota bacterium]|nr:glycosyltransferase family 2 protein [Gemmatimonadota bacterium]
MIYVCIPVHNEASTVGVLLWKIRRVLGEFGRDYKIIVHDDASEDDTGEVLQRYRRAVPLTVLRSEERLGYGRAVERLLRHVASVAPYPKRDCAVVMQGDFTENPEDVVDLVKVFEGGADIVAGREDGSLRSAPDGVRWTRRLAGFFLRGLVRSSPVSDPFAGMRAYRVIVLKKAFRDLSDDAFLLRSDGWAANVELLGQLAPHARRVDEAPLTFRYDLRRRPSRFNPFRTFLGLARLGRSVWADVPRKAEAA